MVIGHHASKISKKEGSVARLRGEMSFPDMERVKTYLVVDEGCEREEIKKVGEETPHISVPVFAKAFIVKTVYLRDLP